LVVQLELALAVEVKSCNMKKALIIFVKNNVAGKVKTRLAASVGNKKASEVYQFLIDHTKKQVSQLNADVFVFYSPEIQTDDQWKTQNLVKKLQSNGDLGERMHNAFIDVLNAGYDQAAIIGSDCFGLQTSILENGFSQLQSNDIVIGPANDGGYYFLAMKQPHAFLFENKDWSTAQLIEQTLVSIKESDKQYHLLEVLNDIDTIEDLKNEGLQYLVE